MSVLAAPRRPTQQLLAIAVVAGVIGLTVNLAPSYMAATRLWPSRIFTLPVAILFGPWYGLLATMLAGRTTYLASPALLAAFGVEALLAGFLARRGRSPIVGSTAVILLLAVTLVLFPAWYGREDLEAVIVPLALQRFLNMMVPAVLADLVAALVSNRGLAGHQPAYSHGTLRTRFFHGFVIVAMLPVLALSSISGEVFGAKQETEGGAHLKDSAQSLSDHLADYVKIHVRAVETLAKMAATIVDTPDERAQAVQSVAGVYPGLARVVIADRLGVLRQSAPPLQASVADRPFFMAVLSTHGPVVSDVAIGRLPPHLPRVFIAAPFDGPDGAIDGVAYAILDLPALGHFIEDYQVLPNASVTIVDRQDRVIYAKGDSDYKLQQSVADEPLVRGRVGQSVNAYEYRPTGPRGRTSYLAAFSTVEGTGWKVFMAQPLAALRVQTSGYYLATLGLVLAALLGAVFGSRAFAGAVTRPLEELVVVVRNLSAIGTSSRVVLTADPPAEIASLVEDVNSMQTRLADSYQQLEHLTGELEHKVTVRTGELAGANAVLEEIFRALPGALLVTDGDGIVRICNDTAALLVGRPVAELRGMPISKLFAGENPLPLEEIESLESRTDILRCERTILSSLGEEIPVLMSAAVIQNASGGTEHLRAICIAIDIRDRKKLELELNHAQKLESVGRLAAGVAHEINTPVQFVSDSVHFIREAVGDLAPVIGKYRALHALVSEVGVPAAAQALSDVADAEQVADLDYLLENVPKALDRSLDGLNRVAVIVRAMKEFAYPDQTEMTAVDLNRAINSTLVIARNEYKFVADVDTDFGELPPIICHGGDVNQVILNLVVNAAHAITDVVKGTANKGKITVQTRCDGDTAIVRIGDTGGGIPDATRGRIFDPFFTTKEVGKGTGQGLAIARAVIVEKHGGTLTFETELGEGTTFEIRLPIGGRTPRTSRAAA